MNKHKDGSRTLTKEEFVELNKAYQGLYDILICMPMSIGDYFDHAPEVYDSILRWRMQLQGVEYVREEEEEAE